MSIRGKVRLLFVLTLTGVIGASNQGFTRDKVGKGQIAFTTDRDDPSPLGMCPGCEEIYVMNPDGTGAKRLTDNGANDLGPAWSPDGQTIAFHTNRNGHPQVFLMDADGDDQRFLADVVVEGAILGAQFASWSHNGRRLCFSSFVRPRDIFIVAADGTGMRNLTDHPGDDLRCDWSPKGKKIAFGSNRDGNEEIYVMNLRGSVPKRLTDSAGVDANPDWSPSGKRIAFESNRDGNSEIYVMHADGTRPVRLTEFPGQDTKPSWSPNGKQIAFHRRIEGHLEVFVMNADGSDVHPITDTPPPGYSGFPSWGRGHLSAHADDDDDGECDHDEECDHEDECDHDDDDDGR